MFLHLAVVQTPLLGTSAAGMGDPCALIPLLIKYG